MLKKIEKTVNIDEIIFYLKYMYSTHDGEPRSFIDDIPTDEPSFETMTNFSKTFSKCIKDDGSISLKNKCLFGGWFLMASKLYGEENLADRFEVGHIAFAK